MKQVQYNQFVNRKFATTIPSETMIATIKGKIRCKYVNVCNHECSAENKTNYYSVVVYEHGCYIVRTKKHPTFAEYISKNHGSEHLYFLW
ncbi:MAG: hypothetical protein EOM76_08915 [Sphingobacteriia bacterium]|nr:hypothetical protein [Sphingobacteriia bacterium]